MMAYNNNYENIESSIFNDNYGNQDDINNTSLNIDVEVLPPVKTSSMSNNLVACLDNNEIDKSNISQMLVLLKNIVEDNVTTIAYMKRLDGRLDKIEKAMRDVTYGRNNVNQLDDDFLTLFPIPDIDCLKNIEEKIKNDEEFKLKLNNLVMSIDGTDVKNFVKRTAIRLFSNDLSSKCSWYGHKNNFKLQNLGIINIMKEISKHYFKNTDIVFETNIKEWFRHGAQRVQRDNKNHN
ncbi:protein PF3D7_1417600-like [Aphis gossypii]|uniref:protein PF3D7_1417600-like n=1 Tax=Aphis gossypii TaxID=80765 RepID=UPI0021599B3E|nr:protein PF3D7_1417600-like [Aphis gossypii]XP_050062275.1 protein PF3D7_1417600-like [Aphis gossypii]